MIRFTANQTDFTIDLKNGVWLMDFESATGKTFLFKSLRAIESGTDVYYTFSYEDLVRCSPSLSEERISKCELAVFDRYDLYAPLGAELINRLGKVCPVLVDCKHNDFGLDTIDSCFVLLRRGTVEVVC